MGHEHIVVWFDILTMTEEIRFYRSWVNAGDFHAKIPHFFVKGIAKTSYGKFRCTIGTHLLVSLYTGDGREVDDVPKALFFHRRQGETSGIKQTGDIGIEHFMPLLYTQFFAEAKITESCVVDENIDVRMGVKHGFEGGLKRLMVSHIGD